MLVLLTDVTRATPYAAARPTRRPSPPARPPSATVGRVRRVLRVAFWSGLVLTVGLWWLDTPARSVDSVSSGLIEAGRITGLIAGYVLLIQILLMSRVGWLDRRVSANDLVLLHRDLGGLLLVLVLGHASLLIVGYAGFEGVGWWGETLSMLRTYEDMISAFVATGILLGVGLLAIRAVRRFMPYELWQWLHRTTYLVLLLSYGHQFADGREMLAGHWGRPLWIGLYGLVLGCLVWGRIVAPLRLNLRHRLRVAQVVAESEDTISVYIQGRDLDEMQALAGQFFRWRFMASHLWSQAHPFSLSAAPNGHWLRLTVKTVGGYTEQLRWLEPGTRVYATGPSGVFTAEGRTRHRALLIAGGSGIAPIRALLEDLPGGTVVIYRASSPDDLIFRAELDWLAAAREAEIHYVIGGRNDPAPRSVMSTRGLRRLVPDVSRRDVFLCGPPGLVDSAVRILRRLHVPRRQIHMDPFEL